jgi:hypothetical protein
MMVASRPASVATTAGWVATTAGAWKLTAAGDVSAAPSLGFFAGGVESLVRSITVVTTDAATIGNTREALFKLTALVTDAAADAARPSPAPMAWDWRLP